MASDDQPGTGTRRGRREVVLGALLLVCLGLTGLVWWSAREADRRVAGARFERISEMARRLALGGVGLIDGALGSARGLILGSEIVEPHEWKRFTASLREQGGLPGVRELAYLAPETDDDGTESIRVVLRDVDRSEFSETHDPAFRVAARIARDSGRAALTVTGDASSDVSETLHLLLPVYRNGSTTAADPGRDALRGWVCAWLAADGLFADVLGSDREDLRLLVTAAPPGVEGPTLFDSGGDPSHTPRFRSSFPVVIGGRTWTATVSSRPAFEDRVAGHHPWLLAIGGAFSFGLWAGVRTVWAARDRAIRIADRRTREMRETEGRYREVFLGNAQPQLLVDPGDGRILDANPSAREFYGFERDGLQRRRIADLCTEDDQGCERLLREVAELSSAREFRARHRLASGLVRDVDLTACAIRVSGRPTLHVAIRDVTGRSESEEIAKITARVFETAYEGILITDRYNRIQMANPAFTRISGYDAAEVRGEDLGALEAGLNPEGVLAGIRRSMLRDGTWQGELYCRRKDGSVHPARISISAIAEPGHRAARHVVVLSDLGDRGNAGAVNVDVLTGLPDREVFRDLLTGELRRARRGGSPVAVMILDVDGFRAVNESRGKTAGDAALRTAAERIRTVLRASDTLGRFGGDAFAIAAPSVDRVAECVRLAHRVLEAVRDPILAGGEPILLRASLGVARAPSDGSDADRLLRHAETALSRAKRDGGNGLRLFSTDADREAREHAARVGDLLRALDRNEFDLYWQPIRDLRTSGVVGAEALLRWLHPEHGLIEPDRFLEFTADRRISTGLGSWVARNACAQAARWHGIVGPDLRVSINLASGELRNRDVLAAVEDARRAHDIPAHGLAVEIRESTLLREARYLTASIGALRDAGIDLVVDDAGREDPSLAYLDRLRLDGIKIDPAVVARATGGDTATLTTLTAAARARGLGMCGEGIESEASLDLLRRCGATLGQGFHLGRPMRAAEFERSVLGVPS
jgi:diguanylate cyclase (GGDEF)-like protein/PAS domain S-box-containing protein